VLYERYRQFQTLILHSREVIESNRTAIDEAFNRFDGHNGERVRNNDGNNNENHHDGNNNRNNNDDSSAEDNGTDSDNDNDHHGIIQAAADRGAETDATVGNVEAHREGETDDESFANPMDEEEVIQIYSDAETIESGNEEEQQRPRRSSSLNDTGSDDTTLVGSSQPSNLNPTKRGTDDTSSMLVEDEKQAYRIHFASSPCPKRARAPTMDTETPIVIYID
jgi:hypothetical protein